MISVIIPTYQSPEALDLCIRSCLEGEVRHNEIIVVVDGFYDMNKEVIAKYTPDISTILLEENMGMVHAMNTGVYAADCENILVVNDDNVFSKGWDNVINELLDIDENRVISINQIEPTPSMFRQFHIKDLGRDPKTFDLENFWNYANEISEGKLDSAGNTPPFAMKRHHYLSVGGWDENYPGPWVVDWDFFLKCELNGFSMLRTYAAHFYHFVSLGTTDTREKIDNKRRIEAECHEFFRYKWGQPAKHNPENNSKMIEF